MSGTLAKLAGFFVAPAPAEAVPAFAPPSARQPTSGVLAPEDDLLVAAGAAAGALRRAAGASCALVCVWRGHGERPLGSPAPAAPAAARLAGKLARRDLVARASGAVCVVELPADAADAAAAARAAMAAADVPAVVAVARRERELDRLLASLDRIVLALPEGDPPLEELAMADVAELGLPAERYAPPSAFVARQAARLGFGASGAADERAAALAASHSTPARSTT
jgi:hypothetical protein